MSYREFNCEWCGENTATLQPSLTLCDDCATQVHRCETCGEWFHDDHMAEGVCGPCYKSWREAQREKYDDERYARRPAALWGFK